MRGSSQQGLQLAFDRFFTACDQAGTKIGTENIEALCLKTPVAVYSASERKYTAAGGDVQVPWGGIYKRRKSERKGLIQGFVKQTQFSVALLLRGDETAAFKKCKTFSF